MKSTLFSVITATAVLTSITSHAAPYAGDLYLNGSFNHDYIERFLGFDPKNLPELDYFGGAQRANVQNQDNNQYVYLQLPAIYKRYGVYKLQKSSNGEQNGPRVDLIFPTKEEATGFCATLLRQVNNVLPYGKKYVLDSVSLHTDLSRISSYGNAIAVSYSIAYDTGSQEASDGSSIKAQKYVFCDNPWRWEPNPDKTSDENEETGILSSETNATNTEYTATCMPGAHKPPSTFKLIDKVEGQKYVWSNGTPEGTYYEMFNHPFNKHELDENIGAQYCPVSSAPPAEPCIDALGDCK